MSAEWHPMPFSPAALVALDHASRWVVLAVRGTLSGPDTITDACAHSAPFLGGTAHAGFALSAWQVVQRHVPAVAAALAAFPEYQLVLTGHSMGGGVAALVSMLLRSDDADVRSAVVAGARPARSRSPPELSLQRKLLASNNARSIPRR